MLKAQKLSWIKNRKQILHGINIEITKGECLGLVGPNGSGKSSLIKILTLLEPPTSGKILLNNQEIPSNIPLEIRRKIAVVFQDPLLLIMNVFLNIAVGLKIRGLRKTLIEERVEYWLASFGISHLTKQHVRSLSGGEAQRVSLARAFALNPEILFLDEPFSSLDAPTTEELLIDLNRVFQSTGITSLIVSHDFREIKHLTNRVYVMLKGEIQTSGLTAEILPSSPDTELQDYLAPW